jgi:hypothetical protein
MKKEEKEKKEKQPKKKSKKTLFLVLGIVVLIAGGLVFFMLKGEKPVKPKKENIAVKTKKIVKEEPKIVIDSVVEIDTLNISSEEDVLEVIEIEDNSSPVKRKRKKSVDHENKPGNWQLVNQNEEDTSYFIIKNKITGTKLANRYYSKLKGDKELQNFKNILSN